ncbi:MAG: hypothetical protein LUD12_10275 [Lachnospiraceae bacterium]|nr:hypothetical protein [Lachnospiraceae bacterium]
MDTRSINDISSQLSMVCGKLGSLASGSETIKATNPDLAATYEDMLLDEIKHVQILALELTKLAVSEERADDGAFAEGELNSVLGEEEDDE